MQKNVEAFVSSPLERKEWRDLKPKGILCCVNDSALYEIKIG